MNRKISNFQAILILITLLLTLKIYALEVINPVPTNGTANPTNVQVRFRLQPDTAAVAPTTVNITINNITFNHEDDEVNYYLMSSDYIFSFDPLAGFFDYGDSVNVVVTAQNTEGVPMEPYSWYFYIYEDLTPPFIVAYDPTPTGVDMEVDDDIIFDVTDVASGVIRDSVTVQITSDTGINDGVYNLSGDYLIYQPISGGYRYTLDLPGDFDNNESVTVTIYAIDESGNESLESYILHVTFVYETYTTAWAPYPNQTNVNVNTTIFFEILNMVDSVYVDSTTILVRIQEQGVATPQLYTYDNNNVDIQPRYNAFNELTGYQVTIIPVYPFGYNNLVNVRIDATNSLGEDMETDIYSFTTWNDETAPYISDRNPASNEEDVALDSPISFWVTDERSGVDISTMEVYVNSNVDSILFMEQDALFTYEPIDDGYAVTVNMPIPFGSEELINVEIIAYDNLGNQRLDSYHFTTVIDSEDETPPFLWSISPENGATNLPLDTEISFYVYDFDPGVDPTTIDLRVNATNINASNFTIEAAPEFGLTEDEHYRAYHVSYQLSGYSEGPITWQSRADDYLDNHYNQYYQEEPFTFAIVESEPPYMNLPAEFVFLEDHDYVIDFRDYAGDPDGEFPDLSVIGDNNINVDIADYMVTLSTETENWNGEETLTFTVTDGSGTVNDAVLVRVIPVNDAPVINLPVDGFTFAEDSSNWVDFDVYVSDVDAGDQLLLQATGNISVLIAFNGLDVNISSSPDWNGTEDVTFTVFDSGQRTGTSQTIPIIFVASPDLPELDLPNMIIIAEDGEEEIDFTEYIYDPEGLEIELGADANNNININIQGTMVTLTPDEDYWGETELTFRIRYTGQTWVEDNTIVRVLPVNDPPELNLPPQVSIDEDSQLILDFSQYVSDVDNDNSEIYLGYYGNQHIAVNIDSTTVTLIPEGDWNGSEGIYFVAQDIGGAAITAQLTVNVNPMNDDPEINFPPYIEFAEDTNGVFDLSNYITDIDGDDLVIEITGNDSISHELIGMTVTFSAPENWFGAEDLDFAVSDGMGGNASGSLEVRVYSVNDAPIMNLPDFISFDEDNTLFVNFADSLWVIDLDGDALTILPSGNSNIFTEASGATVVFSAEENWNGSEEITFHTFDGNSGVVFSTMTVVVIPVNDAPAINLPREFNLEENDEFVIDMMAYITDVDLYDYPNPDELTITCPGSEHITVEIDNEDMEAIIIPDPNWINTEVLTFTVEDESEASASDDVDVIVTSWQNNHQPVINQIPAQYFDEDDELTIDFVAAGFVTDSDGDDLIITIFDNQLVEAAGSGLGSVITFSAGENVNGSEEVSILVDDQHGGYDQGTMNIVINPVEDVLQFNITGTFSVVTGSILSKDMSEYVVDVDDGNLFFTWEGNENISITQVEQSSIVNIQGIGGWIGSETVTFTVTDFFQPVSDSILIQVTTGDWNHAPEFVNLPESFTFDEDTQFEFDFTDYIFDPDTDPEDDHLLMVTDLYNALHIQITGLEVTIWANDNWNGEDELVTFWVYDTSPGGGRAYDTAIIPIIVDAVNDAPWIELPTSYTFIENDDLTVDLNAFYGDVDGTTPFLSGINGDHIAVEVTGSVVTFTAEDDWVGADTLSFMVNDGVEAATDSILVIVTESSINNPPVISEAFPDSIGFDEDTTYPLDFNDYVTDEEGDDWMVTFAGNQYISTSVSNNIATFHPAANWNGNRNLNFTVYELRSRDQVSGQISVTVFPVNDAPVINITQDIIIEENDDPNWDFSQFISDIDSYSLELTATGNDTIYIEILGDVVHFDPLDNWYGVESVTFTVSDGFLQDSQLVIIEVVQGSFNHAPEINVPEPITLDEDVDLEIDFAPYLYDADGDELALNVEYNESVVATIEGLIVTFRPSMNWYGDVNLEFTVYDTEPGNRSSASQDVQIVVNSVNDAPELDLPDSWEFADNGSLTENFRDYSFDADGDLLTITWDGNENINIARDGYLITFTSPEGWYGTELINFHATDEGIPQLTATDSVQVTVTLGANNHPPQLTLPDTLSLQEDVATEFNFGPYMYDQDGDDLIITAGYNANIGFTATDSLVTLMPAANYFGSQLMTFTVYDSQGGRASVSQEITIDVTPVNDAPTIDLPASITFSNSEQYPVDFAPFMNDVDGETLVLTAEGWSGITVFIANTTVIFDVVDEYSGTENITFTVTDGIGETDNGVVQVTAVSGNVNTPPVIQLPEEGFTFAEDGELVIDFEAEGYISDIDEDPLSLLVYGNENIQVTINGAEVTFTSIQDWYGDEDLAFYVFDDMGRETASDEVNVVVTPVNDAPVINLPPQLMYTEGEGLYNQQFSNYISDVDAGDELTLSVEGNVNIDVEIRLLGNNIILVDFSSDLGFSGTETMTFTVTDQDSLSASDNISIIVDPGEWNHAPEFTDLMPTAVSIKEDTEWEADFTGYVSDQDPNDEIVLQVSDVDNIDVFIDGLDVRIVPNANWYGSTAIHFTAYDTETIRASAEASMTFTVRPQNDDPVLNLPTYISFVENDILRINFANYIQDVDGDAVNISWEGNEYIIVDQGGGYNIDFSEDDFYGIEDITFRIEDDSTGFDTDIMSVEVLQGQWNHAPTIVLPDQFIMDEDIPQQFDFGQYIDDIDDDDQLIITCAYNEHITVSIIEDTLVYLIPDEDFNGITTLYFNVIDNVIDDRAIASDNVEIIVNPVNDAPTIELPEELSMTQEEYLFENFYFFVDDVDGDALLLTDGGANHLNITIANGFMVTIEPQDEIWFGEEEISFTVMDPDSLTATDSMIIRVYQGSSNTPPEINLPAEGFTFEEDGELVVDFEAEGYISDADPGDELFISVTGNHQVIIEIDGFEVTFTAEPDWFGSEEMLFYVFDDMTGRSTASDNVEVIVTPVNDDPVIVLPASFIISEDLLNPEYSLNLGPYISDIDTDDDFLQLSFSGNENIEIELIQGTFVINISTVEAFIDTEAVTFTVTDDNLGEGSDTVDIIIEAGEDNHAPTIVLPDNFDLVEDQQDALFNFNNYVDDADGDDMVITAGNYEYLEFDINQLYVTITPEPNWFGTQRVDFVVWDTQGRASATDFVDVIVAPVNDIPVMVLPDSIVFEENSQIEVDFAPYLSDVDGDQLSISWELTDSIDVSNFNYRVSFEAFEDDWYGSEMITFNAADGSSSVSDSVLVVIQRGSWNHAPVLNLPDAWTVAEDEQLILDFTPWASDEDGDGLRISYTYNPLVNIQVNGMQVTLMPAENYFGSVTLQFSLMDNVSRIEVHDSAILNVTPVNDAPTIALPVSGFGFSQSDILYQNFNHFVDDIDSNSLSLSCDHIGNISVGIEEMIVHFYLEDTDWSGEEMITFAVTDDSLSTAMDSVNVTVFQGSTNTPPEIDLPPSLTFNEDMSLQLDFEAEGYVSDEDENDQLELTVSGNENIIVSITGTYVNLSASANWYGTELLTFWVIDEQGQAESDNVPVIVTSVNDAPVIEFPASGFTFQENSSRTIILNDYFYDVDSSNLDVDYTGDDFIIVDIQQSGSTYIVVFTAIEDWADSDTLTFTVTDDYNETASADVVIHVTPGAFPHAPVINLPEQINFNEDENYTFNIMQYISDADSSDYILIFPQPSNHIAISIAPDTLVTLTPAANWNGTETIGFEIFDSQSGSRLSAYDDIEVTVTSVNDLPVLNLPELIEFEDSTTEVLDFNLFVSDADQEVLQLDFAGNDTILVNIVGYSVYLDPPDDWIGEEWITFTVTDSVVSVSDSTLVRVILGEWNHAPEINLPEEGFTLAEDTELQIDFSQYISDPDDDDLIINSIPDPNIAVTIQSSLVTFIPDTNYNGTRTITFEVIDNISRLTAIGQVQVIVTPVNDPPTLVLPPEIGLSRDIPRYEVFTPFINDVDDDPSFTLTYSGNDNISINITNLQVTFLSNWVGSEMITFTVWDEYNESATDSMLVNVYSGQANNDPEITLPDLITFNEDESLQVDFNQYIYDYDGDELSLLVTNNAMITVDIQANELVNFSAATNWSGTERITFIVSDGYTYAMDFVDVQVLPVNDAPTLNLPAEIAFTENTTLDIPFHLYMADVDGDNLNINYSGNDNIDIEVIATTVRLSCSGWFGTEDITFTVDDGEEYSAPDTISVEVYQGVNNHAPEIDMPASLTSEEDVVLIIDMEDYVSDQDDEQLIIVVNGEIHTDITTYGYEVYVNPEDNWNGTETLTFIVYDNVMRASASDVVDIIFTPVNDDPVINLPQAGFNFNENASLVRDFNQYIDDVDNDPLTLQCSGNQHILVDIDVLGVVFDAEEYWSGTETLTFTVNDGNGGSAVDEVDVTVNFVNDPPYIITQIQNIDIQEDSTDSSINLNNIFGDHDLDYGDELIYTCYGDINLQVMENNGAVTITPDPDWNGSETLIFRATDSEDLFVETSVNITVVSVNDLPVVITDPSLTAQADTSGFANVWLSANDSYDIDGEILSVVWSWTENGGGSVEGMIVQQAFIPGYYEITVTATDNQTGEGTATVYLSVADIDNQSPIAYDDVYEVYETQALIVHAVNGVLHNDQDPDNGPEGLTAVLVSNPMSGILQSFEDTGSFIYLAEDITNHDVTFTYQAYDGQAYSLIRTVHITVNEIVLDDVQITINSIDTGGQNGVPITVPILTTELIPDWDVRSFEFDLQFTNGIVQYTGYNLDEVIVDSLGTLTIDETRGNLHCTYSSTEVITGEGALLNIDFFYNLGQTPMEVTNFFFNQTEIEHTNPGAVNNHYPQLSSAITFTDTIFEDFEPITINLDDHFNDLDGDDLSYSVSFDEDLISAVVTDNILELNSVYNQFGSPLVTVTATDGYTLTQPYVYPFYPEIVPVNDLPVINLQDFITFPEDSSLAVNMYDYVSDPDYDNLTFSWSGNTEIDISVENMVLTFSSTPDWNGTEFITINVDDGVTGRVLSSDSLDVIVTPVNDPPVLALPISFSIDEDESDSWDFATEGYVSDPEGDQIILSVSGNTNTIFEFESTNVTISAAENWFGNEFVYFHAQDDQGAAADSMEVQIIVGPLNDPPVIDIDDRSFYILENSTHAENTMNFADSLWIYDVDGNILELTVDDGVVDIIIEGSIVSIQPPENSTPREYRTFTVSDNQGRDFDTDIVEIIVIQDSLGNQPPVIELPVSGFTYAEDEQLMINFADSLTAGYVSDPDDDDVLIIVYGTPNITARVEGLSLTLGTTANFFGADEVVIEAVDNITRASSIDTFIVNVTPVNDPPEIDLPDDGIILAGEIERQVNFDQYLQDMDNSNLELTLSTSYSGPISVQVISTTVIFNAPPNWGGTEIVPFSVIDGGNIPAIDSLRVIVIQEEINHPPVIDLPANFTFNEDEELQIDFTPYITDQDEDDLFISATGNDSISVTISDYNVTLSAEEDWNGMETITFIVYDSRNRASDSDEIQVNVSPVNDPPRFDPVYDFIMENDQTLEIEFANYVSDLEGDSFYLSLSEGEGLEITQAATKFTLIPNNECPEVQNLTLTATENTSGIYSEILFGLFVKAPAIDLDALANAVDSGLFTFYENSGEHIIDFSQFLQSDYDITLTTGYDSSPDNDSLSVILDGFNVTFTPQNSWIGTVYIPFTATYLYDRARRDFEVKVTVRATKSGEDVVPLPHTVTWTDEYCVLRIDSGESPGDITGKILNRRGRLIKELTSEPLRMGQNRYIYQWYKDDDDGNPVDGGLYIYQVDVNG
ncbi:MAG: tandem-95 repeat protein, partial [Candidatus Stygibacter australis]|nr:tandem-95 repeat protein [Candidatus Stygibacter australis]